MRMIVTLSCTECNRHNYSTTKNKKTHQDKLEYKKFCKWCKKQTLHKEVK
jgi:large subunit ribosomal protein L33